MLDDKDFVDKKIINFIMIDNKVSKIDEKILTNSKDIEIYKNENKWYIRGFGRGIQDCHFTKNENKEKLDTPHLIGKFGVGLKDALAVFYRKGIEVEINSKYASVTLSMSNKSG